jgi:hypothetical protein
LITFLQTLFDPPEQLLRYAIAYLQHLSLVAGAGLTASDYLSWVGVLDPAWQGVINALLGSLTLLGVLFIVRAVYRVYLSLKQGIQWW